MARGDRIRVSGIHIEWQPERGVCTFENLPVAMMWVDTTLRGLMQGVQAMVGTPRFILALQSEGRRSVEADWEVISRSPDFRDGFAAIARIAAVAGWGRWEISFYDPENRECRFRVWDGWEAAYQRSIGVCWGSGLLAGKLAGYCSQLFGTNCWADQTTFAAAGASCDEFVVKPSSMVIEKELESLLATDVATRADMAVALGKLQSEIAERIKIEGSLRESEARFRALLRAASDGIHVLDEKGNAVEVNDAFCRMLGYTREELLQLNVRDWDAQWSPEELASKLDELIVGSSVFETRHRRKDGTVREVEIGGVGIVLENRRLIYASARDITERKRAEQALIDGEKLLRETQVMAGLGTYVLDISTGVWTSSAVLDDIFGIGEKFPRSVEGWASLLHPEWRRQMVEYFTAEVLGKHIRFDREYKIVRSSDGGERWVHGIGELEFDGRGRPVRMIGTIRDITGQKQAEESLRLSEQKFRSMAEQLSDVLFTTDSAGVFTYLSPAANAVFGWTPEEMVGRKFTDFPAAGKIPNAVEAPQGGVAVNRSVQNLALPMKRKDGSLFRSEVTSSPILTRGVVTGTIGLIRDVTDRLATEEQLRHAQKMESVGRLAGGIAHDFNNLLTVINGYSDVMLHSLNKADPLWNSIDEIRKAGGRAADLTRQLLAFSRRQVVEPKPVSLNRLVTESWDMLGRLVGEDIEIVADLATEAGQVMADPGQLHQVLMNLVVNARDAMPEGGRLRIAISRVEVDQQTAASHSEGRPGSYVVLTVSDTGIGMSEETRQKIFEPFFTTKGEGTGLGLSTVYGIVRQAGGWIEVDGGLGSGATFRIGLPRLAGPVSEDLPAAPTTGLRGTETVLVVEDQEDVRNLTIIVLKSYGYKVLGARGGGEALAIAEHHPGAIDLLLTDVVMPQMTGKELAVRMKSLRPETRTLFMSGYSEEITSRQGILAVGDYIQKPFSPKALALKVRRVLDERSLAAEF